MFKKILVTSLLSVFCSSAFSQIDASCGDTPTQKFDGRFSLSAKPQLPFQYEIIGMQDNDKQSEERGVRDGVSVQQFLHRQDIFTAQVDTKALVEEVNNYAKTVAPYFKEHSNLYGALVTRMLIFPGYKKPFSVSNPKATKEEKQVFAKMNSVIKKASTCNKEGFCAVTMITNYVFLSDDDSDYNQKDFSNYLDKHENNDVVVYTGNKNYLKPIEYIVVIGTNGYVLPP